MLYTGVVWWIQSVYVTPEHRQQGYFKQLCAAVRDEAQKAGAAGLRLYADDDNKKAHAAVSWLELGADCAYHLMGIIVAVGV